MAKRKALEREQAFLKWVEGASKLGPNVILSKMRQMVKREDVSPTNLPTLDWALGVGGITWGRIYEIYGEPSSGKSALTFHIIGILQKLGKKILFVDAERTYDALFASTFGVDSDDLVIFQPEHTEHHILRSKLGAPPEEYPDLMNELTFWHALVLPIPGRRKNS